MAKRSKELFELLREQREAAEAAQRASREAPADPSAVESETATHAQSFEVVPEGFDDRRAERDVVVVPGAGDNVERTDGQTSGPGVAGRLTGYAKEQYKKHVSEGAGIGGRKVALSFNFILFFVAAFLLTNVMSYMVGSMQRDDAKTSQGAVLTVRLNKYWAVHVTQLLHVEKERDFACGLRDLLKREGFPDAEVHRTTLNNRVYLRTIASKHDDKSACAADARRADAVISKLMRAGTIERDAPIEISIISIQETEKSTGNSNSHVNP